MHKKTKKFKVISYVLIVSQCLFQCPGILATSVGTRESAATTAVEAKEAEETSIYKQRFLELYGDIYDEDNGYFNEQGIPYHSVETLMVEAPDHGHESTSEAASYLLWLQAMKGRITKDYSGVEKAWDIIENYYIPTEKDQPGQMTYRPDSPATYAAEFPLPDYYPSELKFDTKVGQDPLAKELQATYGNPLMYGMHWLLDVDNFYGYGKRGDGVSTPSYINTYQRGEQESVWETIPHPSWEDYKWGGKEGFLSLFTGDKAYSKQWRYTIASDADARVVQAMYNANKWAKKDLVDLSPYVQKASKMGDYLRYSMFDKYFMKIGAQGLTPATGRDSEHYLLSWYYAWGGGQRGDWSWRIGCSHNHFGYQNPMSAWVLSQDSEFIPKSATAQSDWEKSLDRQLEFYQWLQSSEGAIAGGATNSYNGSYDKYPAGSSTFYGMAYDEAPVYADPGSNEWFGMQCWSMQRMAELYYQTGDLRAKAILDKWAQWAISEVKLNEDGTYLIPTTLKWSGQPDTWTGVSTGNPNLHVDVTVYGHDIGVTSSLANTLTYYAAGLKKHANGDGYLEYVTVAKELLNRMWNLYKDDKGIGDKQDMTTMLERFFDQEVYVPKDFSGKMANGDKIENGATFFSIRTNYKNDPDFARLKEAYDSKGEFSMVYHRFWAQSEAAIAYGVMDEFFPTDKSVTTPEVVITGPKNGEILSLKEAQDGILLKADASVEDSEITKVQFYVNNKLIATDTTKEYEANYIPDMSGFVDGKKKVVIKAIAYAANNTVESSAPVTIEIKMDEQEQEQAIPTVSIVSPEENKVFDYSQKQNPITVYVTSEIETGSVQSITVKADDEVIGTIRKGQGSVTFTPEMKNVNKDQVRKIVLSATAVSDKGVVSESDKVTIAVQFKKESVESKGKVNVVLDNKGGTSTNTIGLGYHITCEEEVDLSTLELRYYYTVENPSLQNATVDNAGMSLKRAPWYMECSNKVKPSIVFVNDNLYYLQLTFEKNTLMPQEKIEIGLRITNSSWANYDQTNDPTYMQEPVVLQDNKVVSGVIPE